MVYFQTAPLDVTFQALADPTRRAMIDRLSRQRETTAGELAEPFAMSLPAVLKHVAVLERAGLVAREKRGRTVYCRLETAPMKAALDWLSAYERFWTDRLDALATYLETPTCPPDPSTPTPSQTLEPAGRASSSAGTSRPGPSASSRRGRTRRT